MSLIPVGSEFQVNTFTTEGIDDAEIAVDANGNFVIVWESYGQDGDGNGIFAQRFAVNNAPTITSADTATVPENQTTAIDVDATDDFDSEGSGLTYSLSDGADATLFTIDAVTGVVSFNSPPDFENPGDADADNNYNFQVTVTDSGGLSAVQDITVTVSNLVEDAPLKLIGTRGSDTLVGGDNNDLIWGRCGSDSLTGNGGDDTIFGGLGSDEIEGNSGDDRLFGGFGSDSIFGGLGADRIFGGFGSDELRGGVGDDTIWGGFGGDTFVLAEGEGTDTITDFSGKDVIGLSGGLTFADLSFAGEDISAGAEVLATLTGIDTTTLTASDFTIV